MAALKAPLPTSPPLERGVLPGKSQTKFSPTLGELEGAYHGIPDLRQQF